MPQTLYIVTYPAGGGTPSNVQIVAGQNASGAAASWAGNAEWTGSGQYLEATGLSASTEYDSAAVIYDGTTYSNVVQVVDTWTTLSSATDSDLTLLDVTHVHSVDSVALTSASTLTVTEATHVHSVDSVALTSASVLAIVDATHAHVIDSVALSASGAASLTITEATHAHAVDNIALASQYYLGIVDATHAHSVDSVALDNTNSALLTVTDVTHAHSVDSITLTTASALAIADALHAHVADSVALSTVTQSSLTVADALHAHVVGSVALSIPGEGVTLSPEDIAAIADAVWAHSSATDIAIKLAEAWGRLGLDPSKPLISGQTEISFGAIVMALAGNETSSTLTRQ